MKPSSLTSAAERPPARGPQSGGVASPSSRTTSTAAHRVVVGAHIGSGGFGNVDEVTRISESGSIETGLARKVLLDQWLSNAETVARFRREVRLLDELHHPNILPVMGRNLSASPPWFLMPLAETNLAGELEAGRGSDMDWICGTFTAILTGMAYAHTAGRIIHRDLKPANILIVNGIPVISDFGLGRRLDPSTAHLTQSNVAMGSFPYMAPEQFTNAKYVSPATDIYALGKILWEMHTGQPPVVGRPSLDDIPDDYRSFIGRCTEDKQSDRYASASDALVAWHLLIGAEQAEPFVGAHFEEQLRHWQEIPVGSQAEIVAQIAQTLVARRGDEELFSKAVPRLDPLLIEQLAKEQSCAFDVILRSYDDHIQGQLPFDYCDAVANFYRRVFYQTDSHDHKRLILDRLMKIGPDHNRWRVGDVIAELLASIADPNVAGMANDLKRQNPCYVEWREAYFKVADPYARIFADVNPRP